MDRKEKEKGAENMNGAVGTDQIVKSSMVKPTRVMLSLSSSNEFLKPGWQK
jgi:hypothetical protein